MLSRKYYAKPPSPALLFAAQEMLSIILSQTFLFRLLVFLLGA